MMKKTVSFISRLFLAILLSVGFNACKKETPDLSSLLKTIPSSSGGVVGIHVKEIVKDAGCKIEGYEILPGKEVENLIKRASANYLQDIRILLNGGTGILPDCAVVFIDSNRTFLTFSLYDEEKFVKFIENQTGETFTRDETGVSVCRNVAVKGAQGWVCLSNGKSIDPDAIAAYSKLSASQSFLKSDMAKVIMESDEDITGWCRLNVLLENTLSRSEMSMATIASGILFDDGESVQFTLDFEKGEMEFEGMILNDKCKPAKFLLPFEKIDTKTLLSLGDSANAVLAFTVTPKLISKFEKIGYFFSEYKDIFNNVDGTIGLAFTWRGSEVPVVSGLVTTKGRVSNEFKKLIPNDLPLREMEGFLRFSNGETFGNHSVQQLSELLKGCYIGLAIDLDGDYSELFRLYPIPSALTTAALTLSPEDGSVELKLEIKSKNEKENILLTFLEAL